MAIREVLESPFAFGEGLLHGGARLNHAQEMIIIVAEF